MLPRVTSLNPLNNAMSSESSLFPFCPSACSWCTAERNRIPGACAQGEPLPTCVYLTHVPLATPQGALPPVHWVLIPGRHSPGPSEVPAAWNSINPFVTSPMQGPSLQPKGICSQQRAPWLQVAPGAALSVVPRTEPPRFSTVDSLFEST